MKLKYFIVDQDDQLRKAAGRKVERLWRGEARAGELGCAPDDELRLITVLCDNRLMPLICYFIRLELDDGAITDESKIEAFEAISEQSRRRYDHPAPRRQFSGWPDDWRHQMAVALDVPIGELRRLGLGGPLLMSELWGVPLEKVMQYFEEAIDEE